MESPLIYDMVFIWLLFDVIPCIASGISFFIEFGRSENRINRTRRVRMSDISRCVLCLISNQISLPPLHPSIFHPYQAHRNIWKCKFIFSIWSLWIINLTFDGLIIHFGSQYIGYIFIFIYTLSCSLATASCM